SGWGVPLRVSGPETTGTAIGSDITTNAEGEVFAAWPDTVSHNIFMVKSTDGGDSFKGPRLQAGPESIARTFGLFEIRVPAFERRSMLIGVSLAAFRNTTRNEVYLAFCDLSGEPGCNDENSEPDTDVMSPCKTRLWFTRSIDGGAHWQAPRKLSDGPGLF